MSNRRKSGYAGSMASFRTISFVESSRERHALLHLNGKCRPRRSIYVEKRNIIATETERVCFQLQNR